MYRCMDVSHLLIDEVEHELLIRNIFCDIDEHESTKRRKLKDRMRKEKEMDSITVVHSPTWRNVKEEIWIIRSKLMAIEGLLENPQTNARQREKLKTRLVHYRVRSFLLTRTSKAKKHMQEITAVSKITIDLLQKHFMDTNKQEEEKSEQETDELEQDLTKALEEIRNEIDVLNESTCVVNPEVDDTEGEASGGIDVLVDLKQKELNKSIKKSESILKKLTDFEKGDGQNATDLIQQFKNFVVQSAEQEKIRSEKEIELEKQRIKEAEENVERKRRLEKLLLNLNEKIKLEPGMTKLEFPNLLEPVDNKTKPENKEDENETDTNKGKPKPKLESTETESRTDSSSEESVKVLKKKVVKRKKAGKVKREKKSKTSHKKKSMRTSFSSESTENLSSLSSDSSSSTSVSSADSVESKEIGRRRKNKRESKKPLKRVPISDWRLKYDGKDNGRRLGEFLKEVKMRSKAEEISDRELFRGAIHLFSGRAKDWLMEGLENREFRTWSQLKSDLKREFLPPDLDFQLEIQATNRRQARGEKFIDYFHDMLKIFQSMTRPISERRRFEIIWRNMRFDYKNAMTGADIKSLSKLKRFGRVVDENNWANFQRSVENPPRSKTNQVNEITNSKADKNSQNSSKSDKSKNEQGSMKNKSNTDKGSRGKERKDTEIEPMEGSATNTLQKLVDQYKRPAIGVCYNCRKQGHHYGECSLDRHKFCRVCGFPDVLTKTCPYCAKNAESSA